MTTYVPPIPRETQFLITNNGGYYSYWAFDNYGASIQGLAPSEEIANQRINNFIAKEIE